MDFKQVYKYTKDLNVLYVEDDEDILTNTQNIFSRFFAVVDTARDGEEALNIYKNYFTQNSNYYDLVITDINMPIMDGELLIEELNAINIDQVVIVVSAYNDSSRLMNLIELGIANFLLKPVVLPQIMAVLYKTCKSIYNQNERLKLEIEKNILIQKKLFQEEKINSMTQMIQNIAHQWRQPLSVVSTGITSLKIKKEFNDLTDEFFFDMCDAVDANAQYISKILDNFMSFMKGNREKEFFDLKDKIESSLHLVESIIKNDNIELILDLQKDIKAYGCSNEFMQCIISILNNASNALKNVDKNNRLIFISTFIEEDTIYIKIKDNGGGIASEVLPKVFEPYFTTQHQSQGKGLGLYMTYGFIVDGMNGNIEIQNTTYMWNDKNYTGAMVIISLPYNN